MAFLQGCQSFGENKALLHFGEVGLENSLDMAFKAAASLVSMNTLRSFTLMCW